MNVEVKILRMTVCWQNTSMIWNLLRDAKTNGKRLLVLWLDFANVYGSFPNKIIELGVRCYGIAERWIKMILKYHNVLCGRSYCEFAKSRWTRYEKGISSGWKVWVLCFLLLFKIVIEYVQGGKPKQCVLQGNSVGFMDDLSLALPSVPTAPFTLSRTIDVLEWARMSLKPSDQGALALQRSGLNCWTFLCEWIYHFRDAE